MAPKQLQLGTINSHFTPFKIWKFHIVTSDHGR